MNSNTSISRMLSGQFRTSSWLLFVILAWQIQASRAEYTNLDPLAAQQLPLLSRYEDASSAVIFLEEKHWLGPTGIQAEDLHIFRFIGDPAEAGQWDTVRVPFVKGRDTMTVYVSSVLNADGEQLDPDPFTGFRLETPVSLRDASDFAAFQEHVIALPPLKKGSIIEVKFRRITKQPLLWWQSGRVSLSLNEPILSHIIMVKVPEGDTTNYAYIGEAPAQKVDSNFVWWFAGDQPAADSGSMHGELVYSSLDDWQPIIDTLRNRVEQFAESAGRMPDKLRKDLERKRDTNGKLKHLREWIGKNFRPVDYWSNIDFVFTHRPLSRVVETGYGNRFELANLFCEYAAQAGLACDPVILFAGDPKLPDLSGTKDIIVRVTDEKGSLYLSLWEERTISESWLLVLGLDVAGPVLAP